MKTNVFKCHYGDKLSTKRDESNYNTSKNQLGLLLLRLSIETTKEQQIQAEVKISKTILRHHSV